MLIYFLMLGLVSVAAVPLSRPRNWLAETTLYGGIVSCLVLLPGLRSRTVGTDAGSYAAMFDRQGELAQVLEQKLEPGFFLLSWVAHFFSHDYISIFVGVALLVAVCFSLTIRGCSRLPWVSYFVFIVSGSFSVSINGARQGIAIALVFLGFRALFMRRFWLFAASVGCASLFHLTAIVALPAYFFGVGRSRLRTRVAILLVGGFGIAAFDSLVRLAGTVEERFAVYGEVATEGRGLLVLGFLVALCTFFLLFRHAVESHAVMYDILLDFFILGTIIALIATLQGTGASGIRRLSLYFLTSEILLWPIVFLEVRNPFRRAMLMLAFSGAYLLYFGLTLSAFSNLTPYTLNPIISEWISSSHW